MQNLTAIIGSCVMPVNEPCTSNRNLINPQVNVTFKKLSEELDKSKKRVIIT